MQRIHHQCTFCDKGLFAVKWLVAAPCMTVAICDGCVALAAKAINQVDAEEGAAKAHERKPFTLEDLETQVARTQGRGSGSCYVPDRLIESLSEEIGEVTIEANTWNFCGPTEAGRQGLLLELGDVLNVVTAIAMHAGFTLREVAKANDAKMRARMPEGCEE